jgi:ribonuclease BN (tRNA processing enzyme)
MAFDDEPTIATHKSPAHPRDGVMLYRVSYQGKSVVYATDIEQRRGGYPDVIAFARGADLLIHDAQYLRSEYFSKAKSKRGWGHSTVEMAAAVAKKAKVKRLVLFHHEPLHDDRTMRDIERRAKRLFSGALTAHENIQIEL